MVMKDGIPHQLYIAQQTPSSSPIQGKLKSLPFWLSLRLYSSTPSWPQPTGKDHSLTISLLSLLVHSDDPFLSINLGDRKASSSHIVYNTTKGIQVKQAKATRYTATSD